MRVMVMMQSTPAWEAQSQMPSTEMLAAMGAYNEELVKAGIMLDGDGLKNSDEGARVVFGNGEPRVVDGPFTESKELLAGYWIWEVKSFEEAVEWAKRIPHHPTEPGQVELRPIFEAEDFGAEYTPELRQRDDKLREQVQQQHGS
ncbi:YciI family protein [Mumia zhuanghuii]|uniref:YciI family protein n=1 Tax=Mumia zhuanghuii TaxID=2585211 RepID=A0A5C4MKC5_9ACTN|nr:YciI family protein [Mumia zhuanghuii]TNC43278.1 YciI family protein [Mumia zhuanghuii]TNC47461.1 YciI family protein [Mumia zhuanghuii]